MRENEELVLILNGLGCANCAMKIEEKVKKLDYIKEATVNFATRKLIVVMRKDKDKEEVIKEIGDIGGKIEDGLTVSLIPVRTKSKKSSCEGDSCCGGEEQGHEGHNHGSHSHSGHGHEHEGGHGHSHGGGEGSLKNNIIRFGIAFVLFLIPLVVPVSGGVRFAIYFASYVLAGGEVILRACKNILRGDIFDENFLMSIATIGAFAIGEYPEGAAVMLFYQIGEIFQDYAVDRSRKSITSLMDIRPDYANLITGTTTTTVSPEEISVGDFILVKPGEKIPLDGIVVEGNSLVDTTALTGESVPREVEAGDTVLSGCINTSGLLKIKVEKEFGESTVSKILNLVENASNKKAETEKFITKFARVYTPIVTGLAVLIAIVPPIILADATFSQWLYKALVFLVISCPCALVISIPLGFFGGIGGASKQGILVKGSNYLEILNSVTTIVFDKTGTLTKGVFHVTEIVSEEEGGEEELLELAAYAESSSNHPIAVSIQKRYKQEIRREEITEYKELAGHGIKILWNEKSVLAGNAKLMKAEEISYKEVDSIGTIIHIAKEGQYKGYIIISDEVKEDSEKAIKELKAMGIKKVVMLTGDNKKVGEKIGGQLGMDAIYSELLPDEKVERLEELMDNKAPNEKVMFVGDGINDAPVLAMADIGVAMGGLGSDAAIEAADMVIMTDEPSKLISALKIAKKTRNVVWQNIAFAFGIKILVMILGAGGLATMWEAVFADVGVALLAVLNAMRVLKGAE